MTTPNPWNSVPSYLVAADAHSTASGDSSFIDLAKFGVGFGIGAAVGSVIPVAGTAVGGLIGAAAVLGGGILGGMTLKSDGKYIQAAAASGGLSFYNTYVQVSNWFGSDARELSTQEVISNYDKDLGQYYAQNTASVDIGGFIAGSIFPAIGGLNVYNKFTAALNTVKMGKVGENFSGATGLLAPYQANYLKLARAEMAATDTGFAVLNSNMLKAYATGAAEEAIQGAFVSIAVLASMKASPILTDMDAWDMTKNIAEGAIFGGVFGGVIRAVKSGYTANAQVEKLHQAAVEHLFADQLSTSLSTNNRILGEMTTLERFREALPEGENIVYQQRKLKESIASTDNRISGLSIELAAGDNVVGLSFADAISTMPKSADFQIAKILGIDEIGTVSQKTKTELEVIALSKIANNPKSTVILTEEQRNKMNNTNVTYLKTSGEGFGDVLDELPTGGSLSLADNLKRGETITVSSTRVVAGKAEYKFSSADKWNPLDHSVKANQARTIWALDKDGAKLVDMQEVYANDLPLLKKAYREKVSILVREGDPDSDGFFAAPKVLSGDVLTTFIKTKTNDLINAYKGEIELSAVAKKPLVYSSKDLGEKLDTTVGFLEETAVRTDDIMADLMSMHTGMTEHTRRMTDAGKHFNPTKLIETYKQPSFIKLVTDTTPYKDDTGRVVDGMALVKENQRLSEMARSNAIASVLGATFANTLPEIPANLVKSAERAGPGQNWLTNANQGYGTLGSTVQFIGGVTKRVKELFTSDTAAALNSPLLNLATNRNAALEASAINAVLASTPEAYVLNPSGDGLMLRRLYNEGEKIPGNRTILDANAKEFISFSNADVQEWAEAHIQRNGERIESSKIIKAANAVGDSRDPMVFYPIPPDPNNTPFFAFVVDSTITSQNRVSMVRAGSEAELDALLTKIQAVAPSLKLEVTGKNTSLKTFTKSESEAYYKARGQYSADDAISENYINAALARAGTGSQFIPRTDEKLIAEEFLNWHTQQDNNLARTLVATRYERSFAELQILGDSVTNVAESKIAVGSLARYTGDQVINPFVDYIKTALDITQVSDTPTWTAFNNLIDRRFSELSKKVFGVISERKGIDTDLANINAIFQKAGIKNTFEDAGMMALSNSVAARGDLQTFVQGAGSILSSLMLRMDPVNAAVNAIGSPILTAPELVKLREFIVSKVLPEATIKVPGTGDVILSPQKLYANAISNFFTGGKDGYLRVWARENGFSSRRLMEYEQLLDDLAPKLTDTGVDLKARLNQAYAGFIKIADKGEIVTGNSMAEEFNRFVSADMARQLTDVGVSNGVISPKEAYSIINTFVNRTQGVTQASQKPLLFQGPLGSSIGLFQTYQFNMAQQMLRHIGEGDLKTAGLIMGLQGSIFGMRGLPGFEQINANIIGTMSGNTNNRDLYDATYGIAGKEQADWMMYGISSNAMGLLHPDLKLNLYTRGDINPRFATVVPVSPTDIPIYAATAKLFGSMKETVQKLGMGADVWPTILQGIEHSGVSRPLAGLAAASQAFTNPLGQSYTTSNKGNVVASNDLLSLANLTRIAGAKPFDEAIAVEAAFRLDAYKAGDRAKMKLLGESIKTTVIAGNEPTLEQIESFTSRYVSIGGKQENFNKFFIGQMKAANTSQANRIADHLSSPFTQSMQKIMGDYRLQDFNNQE